MLPILIVLFFIYICYYFNFNYLLGIIIILLLYIINIFRISTNELKIKENQFIKNKQIQDDELVTSSKNVTMIYKTKYKSIYKILVKLDFLKQFNQIEYSNSMKNLNTFLYLLNKYKTTNTNIYTLLKDNREQLLNKLNGFIITIPIENKNLIRFIEKNINKLLVLTQYYLDNYSKRISKNIDINYPVYNNINDPQPNPIYSIDYSNNYTFYG